MTRLNLLTISHVCLLFTGTVELLEDSGESESTYNADMLVCSVQELWS